MSHIKSNIPQNSFYSAIKGDFLRNTYSTLCLTVFVRKVKQSLQHMKQKDFKRGTACNSLGK